MTVETTAGQAGLWEQVVAFYAYETALLDDGKFHDWLDLLDDDIRYVMPMRETRQGPPPESEASLPPFYLFNDDKESLESRVARLDTGLALVESPPSSTQRLVTDVLLQEVRGDELVVRSSFLVFQVRDEQNEVFFVGRRVDRLRRRAGSFQVARRDISLAQYVLPRTISVFF
jgi:3-phenylpropionate/cinnamic acid dioxygenase small subunit